MKRVIPTRGGSGFFPLLSPKDPEDSQEKSEDSFHRSEGSIGLMGEGGEFKESKPYGKYDKEGLNKKEEVFFHGKGIDFKEMLSIRKSPDPFFDGMIIPGGGKKSDRKKDRAEGDPFGSRREMGPLQKNQGNKRGEIEKEMELKISHEGWVEGQRVISF